LPAWPFNKGIPFTPRATGATLHDYRPRDRGTGSAGDGYAPSSARIEVPSQNKAHESQDRLFWTIRLGPAQRPADGGDAGVWRTRTVGRVEPAPEDGVAGERQACFGQVATQAMVAVLRMGVQAICTSTASGSNGRVSPRSWAGP